MAAENKLWHRRSASKTNGDGMNQERRLPNILIFVATVFTTVSYGLALDAFLMQQGLSGRATLYLSNLLIGAAAGAWVVQRRLLQHHKQRALKERIEFLSEMNQHIRSVLTSLSLSGKPLAFEAVLMSVAKACACIRRSQSCSGEKRKCRKAKSRTMR